jgi:DnaJ-class molecular chaperone
MKSECYHCSGTGLEDNKVYECDHCGGRGYTVECEQEDTWSAREWNQPERDYYRSIL